MTIRSILYRGAERLELAVRLLRYRWLRGATGAPRHALFCQEEDHISSVPDWP